MHEGALSAVLTGPYSCLEALEDNRVFSALLFTALWFSEISPKLRLIKALMCLETNEKIRELGMFYTPELWANLVHIH